MNKLPSLTSKFQVRSLPGIINIDILSYWHENACSVLGIWDRLAEVATYSLACATAMLHYVRRSIASTVSTSTKLPRNPVPDRTETSPSSTSPSQQGNETFTLPNGHMLGFSLCEPVDAPALFHFHGQGSCRLQGLAFAEDANKIGVRVVCPDRPDIGLSTFDPGRKLLDYPQQIAQLARHLGLETYRVMGGSGGGPYVLGEYPPAQCMSSQCSLRAS